MNLTFIEALEFLEYLIEPYNGPSFEIATKYPSCALDDFKIEITIIPGLLSRKVYVCSTQRCRRGRNAQIWQLCDPASLSLPEQQ